LFYLGGRSSPSIQALLAGSFNGSIWSQSTHLAAREPCSPAGAVVSTSGLPQCMQRFKG
jgi:hypothetical protein